MEWGFRTLAGIDTNGPRIQANHHPPHPPRPGSNPEQTPIDWVNAHYDSIHGRIVSNWRRTATRFELETTIPANTTAKVYLPAHSVEGVTESGKPLAKAKGVNLIRRESDCVVLAVEAGSYRFASPVQ